MKLSVTSPLILLFYLLISSTEVGCVEIKINLAILILPIKKLRHSSRCIYLLFFIHTDPCSQENICGPNAQCSTSNHKITCSCPVNFQGHPEPQQGCVRTPVLCIGGRTPCALGHECEDGLCVKTCDGDNGEGDVCFFETKRNEK